MLPLIVGGGFAAVALTGPISVERVRELVVVDDGPVGVLVFVLVSALLSVAFFPGPLLAGASGVLFGTALGTPVSIAAATLGAVLGCLLSRTLGTRAVERLGGPRVLAARDWATRRGFTGVLLLRLAPGIPYNLVNYCVGLTGIPVLVFAVGTAIGTAPRALAYTALGGQLGSFDSAESIAAIALLVVMGALGIVLGSRDPELRAIVSRRFRRRGNRTRTPSTRDDG